MSAVSRRQFLATAAVAASPLTAGDTAGSPFLKGNYAPVRAEVTADRLEVVGTLPAGLDGLYVRTGPNPQFPPRGPYHWFDGDGMLHGVRLRDGRASYRNRYVRTDGWREEQAAGKALYNGLLGLPDLRKVALGQDGYKNTANTALVWYDGRLLALWEGGTPHAIRAPALETVGRYTFGDKLRHACTAHPKVDPATGELLFFGYQPVTPYLQYSVADARGAIVRTTPIELARPVMMHDFAVTARHTVFLDLPVVFDFRRLLRGESSFGYDPKLGARIGVLPRHGKGSEVRWFPVAPCYVFHTLNAHDAGDEVVLHGCRMAAFPAEIVPPDQLSDRELRRTGSMLYRWRLNLRTGAVSEGPIDDTPADFPRIDERRTGRPVRFGYLTTLRWDALLKVDLERGTIERHSFGKGRQGGEGVFVPRPGATGEDDGWVMAYVYDRAADRSELVVVDAGNFAAAPVARVKLPVRVPFGFHGAWVSGAQLAAG